MSNLFPTVKKGSDSNSSYRTLPSMSSWFDDMVNQGFGTEFMSNFKTA